MKSFSIFRREQLKSDRQLLPLAASCLGGAADPIVRQKQENSNFLKIRRRKKFQLCREPDRYFSNYTFQLLWLWRLLK
jgi:hypothetical protein